MYMYMQGKGYLVGHLQPSWDLGKEAWPSLVLLPGDDLPAGGRGWRDAAQAFELLHKTVYHAPTARENKTIHE